MPVNKFNDPDIKYALIAGAKAGNHMSTLCDYVGITYQTFRNWMIKGEVCDAMEPEHMSQTDREYADFYRKMLQAKASHEMQAVKLWQEMAEDRQDWKGIHKLLQQLEPKKWADKIQIDVSTQDDEIMGLLEVIKQRQLAEAIDVNEVNGSEPLQLESGEVHAANSENLADRAAPVPTDQSSGGEGDYSGEL